MEKLKIEYVDINSIRPYENNAKEHPREQIEQIKKSIEQFGMDDPIGIWKDEIVEGHGRLIACKEMGMAEVPIIRLDHLTDEERRAYTLAHNKLTMNSDFNLDILNKELESIGTINMEDFGFDLDLQMEDDVKVVEDEPPEVPEEAIAQKGDIYQLGNHRIMCGDSTKPEDIEKLLDGSKMDLVVTDPPYNVNYGEINRIKIKRWKEHYKGANTKEIENDNMDDDSFVSFLADSFENLINSLKPGGAFYIWHAVTKTRQFLEALEINDMKMRQLIIWNKSSITLGMSDYQWKHEPCIYGWREGASHYFIDDRTQRSVIELDDYDFKNMKKDELVKLLEEVYSDKLPKTVIDCHKPVKNDLHPTMKPVRLMGILIKNSSKEGEKVLDLFGGSGSTLMACEQLGRSCYMMEFEPKYVDVIIERWENFTGQKAIKLK